MNACRHPLFLALFAVAAFLYFLGGVPGFRDGAHFYAPLFQYQFEEFAAGRLTLWNPYDNYGQPLAANPTTAAFYPVTWAAFLVHYLFDVSALNVYAGYCGFHLLLAIFTMYRLSRSYRCGKHASTLAAIIYALSGQVLFQWNNVPFLAGAAYMPEVVLQFRKIAKGRRHPAFLALVLALMILSGDLQSAYNAVLVGLAVYFASGRPSFRPLVSLGLILCPLCLVQVLPALELGYLSDRTLPEHLQRITYWYSIHPLRCVELFFPNAGGVQFPIHRRWFNALPEMGIWVPSLYMGLLPLLFLLKNAASGVSTIFARQTFSLSNFRFARCAVHYRKYCTLYITILFFLASWGDWCFVYPLFNSLPGYTMFRYPAKMMTVTIMFLALFAACGWDKQCLEMKAEAKNLFGDSKQERWLFCLFLFLLLLCITPALYWLFYQQSVAPCPVFGPFDIGGARQFLGCSVLTALTVLGAYAFLRRYKNAVLIIVFIDLAVSNAWMLAPMKYWEPETNANVPATFVRQYPEEFLTTSSPNRLTELIQWEQRHLFPRYHLLQRERIHGIEGTLALKDYAGEQDETAFPKTEHPTPNTCIFTVELDRAQRVTVAEQYYPGWRAFTEAPNGDRLPLRIHKMEPCFRAVDLPAGKHCVTMVYDPPLYKTAVFLSVLGGFALCFGWLKKHRCRQKRTGYTDNELNTDNEPDGVQK